MTDPREDIDALIVRTREAHEVLKDLKQGIKEVNQVIETTNKVKVQLLAALTSVVDRAIEEAIDVGLENYTAAIQKAILDTEEAVYERFDVIVSILLGEKEERTITEDARLVRKYLDRNADLTPGEERRVNLMRDDIQRKLGGRPSDIQR